MPGKLRASAIGHLGGDPETRFTPNGAQVTSFSVGCSVGTREKPVTEWVRASAWGKTAEIAQQYLGKGSLVEIEGRLTTRSFEGRDGQTRFSLEMNVDTLVLLSRREGEPMGSVETLVAGNPNDRQEDLSAIPF